MPNTPGYISISHIRTAIEALIENSEENAARLVNICVKVRFWNDWNFFFFESKVWRDCEYALKCWDNKIFCFLQMNLFTKRNTTEPNSNEKSEFFKKWLVDCTKPGKSACSKTSRKKFLHRNFSTWDTFVTQILEP